jgi:hypothetical protein
MSLPFLSKDVIDRIRAVDLLTYVRQTAPDDLVKRSTEYRLRSHPRFNISHGKWYDFDAGIGGVSALDYYVKIHGMPFLEAAHMILGRGLPDLPLPPPPPAKEEPKPFLLPEQSAANDVVFAYLRNRGIHAEIIRRCIDAGILYESREYANCVFVGRDREGVPRYAFQRGTLGSFMNEVEGSTKRYGFMIPLWQRNIEGRAVAIFDSPVDALSHATMYPEVDLYRLSLGGTSSKALMQFLADYPSIRMVYACLDNDEAGRKGTDKIRAMLPGGYTFCDTPPAEGKDYNEYLKILQHSVREKHRIVAPSR